MHLVGDLGALCDRVVVRERLVDAVPVLVDKARVVEPRPEGREDAARIVISVVNARLVAQRGAAEQLRFALDEQHASTSRAEHAREAGAVEASTHDDRIEPAGGNHVITTSPRGPLSPEDEE